MDIKRPQDSQQVTTTKAPKIENKFKAGQVKQASAAQMIPPALASKLSHLSKVYGLPIDLGQVSLQDASPENIKAMRKIVDMLASNSKLLPELIKLTSQLLKADIKLAEFHKNLTKAALTHQEKIDQETAEIFIAMARGGAKATKLEHRTNVRNSLIEQRTAAYANYYQDSVFGNESQIIDVEYQLLASNQKILSESKQAKAEFNNERKQKLKAFVDSAFTNND